MKREKRAGQERATVARWESEVRLFEAVLHDAPVAIGLISRQGYVIQFANKGLAALSPGRALVGRSALEVWSAAAERLERLYRRAFETGEPYHAREEQFVVRDAGGAVHEKWVTHSVIPVRRDTAQAEAIVVIVQDVTEHVRARRAAVEHAELARRREAELRSVLDHMVEAVFAFDTDGRLTLVNAAGASLTGLGPRAIGERAIDRLTSTITPVSIESTPDAEHPLERALRGESVLYDAVVPSAPGEAERIIRASAAPIKDDAGTIHGAVAVARDLTDVEQLERLQRAFVRAAAHELNTPLSIVSGYAQALSKQIEEVTARGRGLLDGLTKGVERMRTIIRDLTYVSKLDVGRLDLSRERLRLDERVRQLVARAARPAGDVTLRLVRLDAATVDIDPEGLDQVVWNLLANATRFSSAGSEVDVGVAVEGGEAVLSVRDRGVGIAAARQKRIFERFYRAHVDTPYDYEGLGMGLYISREIVTRQGGRIWFESTERQGSTFFVAFPLAEAPR